MSLSAIIKDSPVGADFLLIIDCYTAPGLALLKSRVVGLLMGGGVDVIVYLFESRCDQFIDGLPRSIADRLQINDRIQDPLGWIKEGASLDGKKGEGVGKGVRSAHLSGVAGLNSCDLPECTDEHDITLTSLPRCNKMNKRCAIVVDSLSAMLDYTSVQETCQWLHRLVHQQQLPTLPNTDQIDFGMNLTLYKSVIRHWTCLMAMSEEQKLLQKLAQLEKKIGTNLLNKRQSLSTVIAVVHQDVHDQSVLNMLEHTADTVIELTEPLHCIIRHKRQRSAHATSSAKAIQHESFRIDQDFNVTSSKMTATASAVGPTLKRVPVKLPTDNLTFNPTVRKEEEEARSNLVLPYVHTGRGRGAGMGGQGEEVRSVGEESLHDFDEEEEDPDDDLDI